MEQKTKRPSYLDRIVNEAYGLIDQSKTKTEIKTVIGHYLRDRIPESFNNGVKYGIKKVQAEKD